MELQQIKQVMEEEIADIEKGVYRFESVIQPRFEKDKQILEKMRDQHIKLASLIQRSENGEDITQQEIMDVVPPQFYRAKKHEVKDDTL